MAGLLNPPKESAACSEMIGALERHLKNCEGQVLGTILDREKYLVLMGEIKALRTAIENQTKIYERTFNV